MHRNQPTDYPDFINAYIEKTRVHSLAKMKSEDRKQIFISVPNINVKNEVDSFANALRSNFTPQVFLGEKSITLDAENVFYAKRCFQQLLLSLNILDNDKIQSDLKKMSEAKRAVCERDLEISLQNYFINAAIQIPKTENESRNIRLFRSFLLEASAFNHITDVPEMIASMRDYFKRVLTSKLKNYLGVKAVDPSDPESTNIPVLINKLNILDLQKWVAKISDHAARNIDLLTLTGKMVLRDILFEILSQVLKPKLLEQLDSEIPDENKEKEIGILTALINILENLDATELESFDKIQVSIRKAIHDAKLPPSWFPRSKSYEELSQALSTSPPKHRPLTRSSSTDHLTRKTVGRHNTEHTLKKIKKSPRARSNSGLYDAVRQKSPRALSSAIDPATPRDVPVKRDKDAKIRGKMPDFSSPQNSPETPKMSPLDSPSNPKVPKLALGSIKQSTSDPSSTVDESAAKKVDEPGSKSERASLLQSMQKFFSTSPRDKSAEISSAKKSPRDKSAEITPAKKDSKRSSVRKPK